MAFDGTEGEAITLAKAGGYTKDYRDEYPGALLAHFFGKDIINDILDQNDCMGIRIYHGIKNGKAELILVGATADEEDMIATGDIIADVALPCPNRCASSNTLNS